MNTVSIICFQEGCGYSPFPMEEGFYRRARRTHEWWHCPAGHRQHFVTETEDERQHRLEKQRLEQRADNWRQRWEEQYRLSRTCPWPTCREFVYSSRDSLYDHMRRAHGMPTLALVKDAS